MGAILFTASGANSGTTPTELLLQKLANVRRTPTDKYISQGFYSFVAGGLTLSIAVESGLTIPAYRFVNALTGEMAGLQISGEVTVL